MLRYFILFLFMAFQFKHKRFTMNLKIVSMVKHDLNLNFNSISDTDEILLNLQKRSRDFLLLKRERWLFMESTARKCCIWKMAKRLASPFCWSLLRKWKISSLSIQ
jgi:hypothetical protein